MNLVVAASHPEARAGDVLLVGQNEKMPKVVQDMAGIRVVRFRPGDAPEPAPEREASCLCAGVRSPSRRPWSSRTSSPGSSRASRSSSALGWSPTPAASRRRRGSRPGSSSPIGPTQTEPGGAAAGERHLEGAPVEVHRLQLRARRGPADVAASTASQPSRQAPGRSLYVNLVAVSAAPFGGIAPGAELPIDTASSELAVTRFRPLAAPLGRGAPAGERAVGGQPRERPGLELARGASG